MRSWIVLRVLGACAPRPHAAAVGPTGTSQPDQVRLYTVWFGGDRIGDAEETETWTAAGVTLRRDEHLRFRRDDVRIDLDMSVVVEADRALAPLRVTWSQRDASTRLETAVHDASGWHASAGHALPAAAVPAELVGLIVRRDGQFTGEVFLPARGFAVGTGRIVPVAPRRMTARLELAAGAVEVASIDVDDDGSPHRVIDGEGVTELRATAAEVERGYLPADIIDAGALRAGPRGRALVLDTHGELPEPPGQRVQRDEQGEVVVELGAELPGSLPDGASGRDRSAEIEKLVEDVRARVVPDLAAAPTSASGAPSATVGDCTTFALAYAAAAAQVEIATKVVTGFRVDGDRLVRHRWAASWTGHAWVAVDVAFGEVPAGGALVGVAVTDATDVALVAADSALAHVRGARWLP